MPTKAKVASRCRGAGPGGKAVLKRWSEQIAATVEELLNGPEPFDSVQIEGMHLVEYLPLLQAALGRHTIVADWHNIESEIMWGYSRTSPGVLRKLYARRTAQLIENMELRLLRGCDVHVVSSLRERDKLLARLPGARIEVVGNGVDVAQHADDQLAAACGQAGVPVPAERRDVLFVGSMDYHANIDAVCQFAETIWPEILARHPELRFVIAGRNPPSEIRAMAELPQIDVTGTVDDVRPWYRSAFR